MKRLDCLRCTLLAAVCCTLGCATSTTNTPVAGGGPFVAYAIPASTAPREPQYRPREPEYRTRFDQTYFIRSSSLAAQTAHKAQR
jgi:hypothetical protein